MSGLSQAQMDAILLALSKPRVERFFLECGKDLARALALYRWNAEIAAAFLVPMHICEVALRNAIVHAIETVYGPNWWNSGSGFEKSLPRIKSGYSPFSDLGKSRRSQSSVGKVIPELKFMFWVSMMTSRHDTRLWIPLIRTSFPGLPPTLSEKSCRKLLHDHVEAIRLLRNRIAHHEPIFDRALSADYQQLHDVLSWASPDAAQWLTSFQGVTGLLAHRP
jgi:hypothetical protein